ncbi:MAG TPA: imidazole glycerol phosphate synthase subunit HisF [Holophagaceae bacterium]|jgi:cyclase|nr:imidazole glycerol phosphate synthase subunit HisF [Holophagaceae bacterium]
MPARRIIPCLDVKDGRVVKGIRFEGLRDMGDPAELAARYDAEGADELVFLDISASAERRATQAAWVRAVAERLSIPFCVGGGVGSVEDARLLLRAGADKVAVNTAAVRRPGLVRELAEAFGAQCVVAAVDLKRDPELGWRVFVQGGKEATDLAARDWLPRLVDLGAGELLLTSMDRDGTGEGFDLDLLRLASDLSVPVIASGGAGTETHFLHALESGADAVLAATLFHENTLPIPRLKTFLASHGQEIRPC